jgi:hypothetical protein
MTWSAVHSSVELRTFELQSLRLDAREFDDLAPLFGSSLTSFSAASAMARNRSTLCFELVRLPSSNFARPPAKLLILLHTGSFCSHDTRLIFPLTLAWLRGICESSNGRSCTETPLLHTLKPLLRIVVSARSNNRVIGTHLRRHRGKFGLVDSASVLDDQAPTGAASTPDPLVMSISFVSRRNNPPTTTVIIATTIGYHRPK